MLSPMHKPSAQHLAISLTSEQTKTVRSVGRLGAMLALVLGLSGCQDTVSAPSSDSPDLSLPVATGPALFVATEAELDAAAPKLRLAMVNVGQGDGMVLKLPGGGVVAIDGGPDRTGAYSQFLTRQGISRVDQVLLSHAHSDHYTGLSAAMALVPTDCAARVRDPGYDRPDIPGYQFFRSSAGCRYKPLALNQTVVLDPQVAVELFSASDTPYPTADGTGINNTSLVMRLRYGRFSVLFTGDAQTEAERTLVKNYAPQLKSTVLKVSHHGSCNATATSFLAAVSPDYALISNGEPPPPGSPNDFGHPHCQTIDKLKKSGAHWLRTDLNGEIWVISDGTRYTVTVEKSTRDQAVCPRNCGNPVDF